MARELHKARMSHKGISPAAIELITSMKKRAASRSVIRNLQNAKELREALSKVSPTSSRELLSGIAVDLADLVEVGAKHRLLVNRLLRLKLPKDKERFRDLLISGTAGITFFENAYHIANLRKRLPRLLKEMSRSK